MPDETTTTSDQASGGVTPPAPTAGAPAAASEPPLPPATPAASGAAPGMILRLEATGTPVLVLAVIPAEGDRPERIRVAELGRESSVVVASLSPV